MRRYNEYTEEDIESLADECDHMYVEISRLYDIQCNLLEALKETIKNDGAEIGLPTLNKIRAAIAKAEAKP